MWGGVEEKGRKRGGNVHACGSTHACGNRSGYVGTCHTQRTQEMHMEKNTSPYTLIPPPKHTPPQDEDEVVVDVENYDPAQATQAYQHMIIQAQAADLERQRQWEHAQLQAAAREAAARAKEERKRKRLEEQAAAAMVAAETAAAARYVAEVANPTGVGSGGMQGGVPPSAVTTRGYVVVVLGLW